MTISYVLDKGKCENLKFFGLQNLSADFVPFLQPHMYEGLDGVY